MRILVLNADYENFLRVHYRQNPGLAEAPYDSQMASRNESLFAVSDFYSRNFRAHGCVAAEIHVNNPFLQRAWAREHGLGIVPPPLSLSEAGHSAVAGIKRLLSPVKPLLQPLLGRTGKQFLQGTMAEILKAQIADFRPDVILNQEMDFVRSGFFKDALPVGCKLVGQIATELPQEEDFRCYDLVITSFPDYVDWFRARGVRAEFNLLAFESGVLDAMGPPPPRDIPVSFVGSLWSMHSERITLLEYIARRLPLQVWGNGIERLSARSPLRAAHRGIVWGRRMYDILYRSRISLNHHANYPLVRDTANNMRLYEATGMGSLLLTDAKSNLSDIFEPGREVATYSSPEECVARLEHYLAHEEERVAVAAAGQRRTLASHNYFRRTGEILDLIAALA